MIGLRNPLGGITYVHESREEEYLARGFKHIAEKSAHIKSEEITEDVPKDTTEKIPEVKEEEKPKRTVRKKR